jgi:hypothetical protein
MRRKFISFVGAGVLEASLIMGLLSTCQSSQAAPGAADASKAAGGNIRFGILANHDHDVWTDTYPDPQFYDWLLQHKRPRRDAGD